MNLAKDTLMVMDNTCVAEGAEYKARGHASILTLRIHHQQPQATNSFNLDEGLHAQVTLSERGKQPIKIEQQKKFIKSSKNKIK